MSRLDELIAELCPDGVVHKNLCDISNMAAGDRITKAMMSDEAEYPVMGAGVVPTGYYSDWNREKTITISRAGVGAGIVGWHPEKFWATDVCFTVDDNESGEVDIKYLFYAVKSQEKYRTDHMYGGSMPKIDKNYLWHMQIPVPPLPVQEEIVRILDNFTKLTEELTTELVAELTARKQQYEYYSKLLLDLQEGTPLLKLGDICALSSGGDAPKGHWDKEKTETYQVPIYSNGLDEDGLYGYTDVPRITEPSVTIAGRGAGVGNAILRKDPYFPIIRLVSATPDERVNVDYLYHCIRHIEFKIPQGGIPQLTVPMVSQYEIYVPDINIQKDIVEKLNAFEKIIKNITIGLPAEIEARQKQYEYYRDKLLTFKEKKI